MKVFSLKSQEGMTLIELLMAIVLVAILSGFVSNILYYQIKTYEIVTTRKENIQSTRFAIQLMAREIRQIASPDSIFGAAVDSLRFRRVNGVTVSYHRNHAQLYRNSDLLLDGVSGFRFSYYDTDGEAMEAPIPDFSKIRRISFTLASELGGQPISNEVSVALRNF